MVLASSIAMSLALRHRIAALALTSLNSVCFLANLVVHKRELMQLPHPGMGIHNEPGFTHLKPYPSLPALIEQILGSITSTIEQDSERGFLENLKHDGKDESKLTHLLYETASHMVICIVVLLVNNLGSISQLEMGGIIKEGAIPRIKPISLIQTRIPKLRITWIAVDLSFDVYSQEHIWSVAAHLQITRFT